MSEECDLSVCVGELIPQAIWHDEMPITFSDADTNEFAVTGGKWHSSLHSVRNI